MRRLFVLFVLCFVAFFGGHTTNADAFVCGLHGMATPPTDLNNTQVYIAFDIGYCPVGTSVNVTVKLWEWTYPYAGAPGPTWVLASTNSDYLTPSELGGSNSPNTFQYEWFFWGYQCGHWPGWGYRVDLLYTAWTPDGWAHVYDLLNQGLNWNEFGSVFHC